MEKPLWIPSPDSVKRSNMTSFMHWLRQHKSLSFTSYEELYDWSVNNIAQFWESIWVFSKIKHSQNYNTVVEGDQIWNARWFEGARLNFAENLLRYDDDRSAIIHWREDSTPTYLTYAQLFRQVAACAAGLKRLNIKAGDRIAAYIPNIPEALIAMLAATSLGAIWSSCSPDFGLDGALGRFSQISPQLLLTTDGYRYNGRNYDSIENSRGMKSRIASIENLVVIPIVGTAVDRTADGIISWDDLLSDRADHIQFEQLPFDHPVYIMFSSGTTGLPKCIVHGAGGTLLQHYKEHVLHTNLTRDDRMIYFTTTGWMMWNWLVGSLAVGSTVCLYDGSPSYPDLSVLWRAVDEEKLTIFGTSPRFLSACQDAGIHPSEQFDLTSLKTILSTGSPLSERNFDWVYQSVKDDVQVSSISGGTDIISCFMLGNPIDPVRRGEIQCRGLGMKVETFNDDGQSVVDEVGELVCTAPFPSRPVYFWDDPDNRKYRSAYFEKFENVWHHGDFVKITPSGGLIVHGRSDATLNPGGVRIGTAEIYSPVEGMEQIADSIVVGVNRNNDVEICLFVVPANGYVLDENLKETIRKTIRSRTSPRHVPACIYAVNDIPRTISGKKMEVAVSRIVHDQPVRNREALANPKSLEQFARLGQEIMKPQQQEIR